LTEDETFLDPDTHDCSLRTGYDSGHRWQIIICHL